MRRVLSIAILALTGLVALPAAALASPTAGNNKTTLPVIQFKFSNAGVNENGGQSSISFTRTGTTAQLNQISTVLFTTNGGTATGGSSCAAAPVPDYVTATNRTITFPVGSTLQTTTLLICNQLAYDTNETVNMVLTSPTNAQLNFQKNTSVLNILETNPKPVFTIGNASGAEGSTLLFPVTLTGATGLTTTVTYATSAGTAVAGTNYTTKSGQLSFPPQTAPTTQMVGVATLDDGVETGNLTFKLGIAGPVNASLGNTYGTGTITDVDGPPTISANNASAWEGSPLGFTVSLSHASAFPVSATYGLSALTALIGVCGIGNDLPTATGPVSFAPGVTSQPVSIPTCSAGSTDADRTFTLALTSPTDGSAGTPLTSNGTGTIKDLDPATLSLATSQSGTPGAAGQVGNVTATVTNLSGDELSGHLVRYELYQYGEASFDSFGPLQFGSGANQEDLGQLVAGTPTCAGGANLGCAAFDYTGDGISAAGTAATETAGQSKMRYTAIDDNPFICPAVCPDPYYVSAETLDVVVACLADDAGGVAAAPDCGVVVSDGNLDNTTGHDTSVNTLNVATPGASTGLFYLYSAPN